MLKDRDEFGPEVPNFTNSNPLLCDNHFTPSQRADVAVLQQRFADIFYPVTGFANIMQQHIETQPGVMVCSQPYQLPEHEWKVVLKELKVMLEMGNNTGVQQCLM